MVEIPTALDRHDEWMQAIFWLFPNSYLDGETPLERMNKGDVAAVIRAATS